MTLVTTQTKIASSPPATRPNPRVVLDNSPHVNWHIPLAAHLRRLFSLLFRLLPKLQIIPAHPQAC